MTQDTGYKIYDTGYRIQDTGHRIYDTSMILTSIHSLVFFVFSSFASLRVYC